MQFCIIYITRESSHFHSIGYYLRNKRVSAQRLYSLRAVSICTVSEAAREKAGDSAISNLISSSLLLRRNK